MSLREYTFMDVMTQEKIACPSCGGMGIIGSVCEYCGSIVQPSIPILEKGLPTTGKKNVSSEQYAEKISKYQTVSEYYGNLAIVSIGQRFGLIDRSGNLAISLEYDNIRFLIKSKGLFVINQKEKCALLNDDGKILIDFKYDKIDVLKCDKYQYVLTVKLGQKFALFDIDGKPLTDFKYDWIDTIVQRVIIGCESMVDMIYNPKGLLRVRTENCLGVINSKGKEVVPCNCDNKSFSNLLKNNYQYIRVEQNRSVGLFDDDGNEILPCAYYSIRLFNKSERYILTQKNEREDTLGLFDLESKQVLLPCTYSFISESFPDIIIKNAQKSGVYNIESEKIIVSCQYREIVKREDCGEMELYYNDTNGFFTVKIENGKIVKVTPPKELNTFRILGVLGICLSLMFLIIGLSLSSTFAFEIYIPCLLFLIMSFWAIKQYIDISKYRIP